MDIINRCAFYDITKLTIIGKNIFSFAAPIYGENDPHENQYVNNLNDYANAHLYGVSYSWYMKTYKKKDLELNANIKEFYSLISKIKYFYQERSDEVEKELSNTIFIGGKKKAIAALTRIINSFNVILFLLRNGYYIESCTIMRQCLEQLAWVLYVNQFSDDNYILKDPQSCIKYLKKHSRKAGKLYGFLSKIAHLTEDIQDIYFLSDEKKIVFTSIQLSVQFLPITLDIVFLFCEILLFFVNSNINNYCEKFHNENSENIDFLDLRNKIEIFVKNYKEE